MDTNEIKIILLILLLSIGNCWAGCCAKSQCTLADQKQDGPVDMVLTKLSKRTKELQYYQARVEYKFIQPLFESTTRRKGMMYYAKFADKSKLRVDFKTLKQDDEKEILFREEFIFDGIWLTQINYQSKQVRKRQMAEPNKPVDAFELAGRNLPIIGFAKIEELKKQFEINMVEQQGVEKADLIHLHLKVKPDSMYKDNYTSVDFWIDKKLGLPAKITAVSTEEDIYKINLVNPIINKKIDPNVFEFIVPDNFGKEVIPLKKTDN